MLGSGRSIGACGGLCRVRLCGLLEDGASVGDGGVVERTRRRDKLEVMRHRRVVYKRIRNHLVGLAFSKDDTE